ncbi:MAG: hypothetical protein ACE5H1_01250 [Thermodesulfobacteriota bacterium]
MKAPPFTEEEKQTAIRWAKAFQKHKDEKFCTICEEFNCTCESSECYKILHPESVIAFLRYNYNIRVDELDEKTPCRMCGEPCWGYECRAVVARSSSKK